MARDVGVRERFAGFSGGRSGGIYFLGFFVGLAVVGAFAVIYLLRNDATYSAVVTSTTEDVRLAFESSDLASYLTLALDWRDGQISESNLWIRRLWAPGAPAVLTVLDVLPGPLVVTGAVGAVAAWAGTAAAVAAVVAARGRLLMAVVFAALWVAAPMTLTYAWGSGLLLGDGLGVMCVVLALLALFLIEDGARGGAARRRLVPWGIVAGVLLAGAIYMRWALAVSVGAVVLTAAVVVISVMTMRLLSQTRGPHYLRALALVAPMGAMILAFLISVAPWAVYRVTVVEPGSVSWVSADFMWGQRWLTDGDLVARGGGWLVAADANWSCDIDPTVCEGLRPVALAGASEDFELLKEAALRSIVRNPVGFVQSRLGVLASTWFRTVDAGERTPYSAILGWVILGTAVFGTVLGCRRWRSAPLFVAMLAAMIGGQAATLAVSHVEVRYLMPLTALTLTGTALLSTLPPRPPAQPQGLRSSESMVDGPLPRP